MGVDQDGAKDLVDAAKEAGIKKFVMLSTLGADNPSVSEEMEDYLKASGLNYTIVRPGSLTNKEGTGKIELKEKMESFGKITSSDVAKTLVGVLEDDVMQNQVFEILARETRIEKAFTY